MLGNSSAGEGSTSYTRTTPLRKGCTTPVIFGSKPIQRARSRTQEMKPGKSEKTFWRLSQDKYFLPQSSIAGNLYNATQSEERKVAASLYMNP